MTELTIQDWLHFSDLKGYVSVYDEGACCGVPYSLDENEVRRLHSFLSQWLETNQKDYF